MSSDQMQLLLKASESLSELYYHDFYPPPPAMNTSFPGLSEPSNCQHASHKWEKKAFQLLFNRELERSQWDQERSRLAKENEQLQKQVQEMKNALVKLDQDVGRFKTSFLLMHGSINHGYDQLQSKCLSLEEKIYKIKGCKTKNSQSENQLLLEKLKELKSWSESLLKDD